MLISLLLLSSCNDDNNNNNEINTFYRYANDTYTYKENIDDDATLSLVLNSDTIKKDNVSVIFNTGDGKIATLTLNNILPSEDMVVFSKVPLIYGEKENFMTFQFEGVYGEYKYSGTVFYNTFFLRC